MAHTVTAAHVSPLSRSFSNVRLESSFPIGSSSQNDSIADQVASQPANRFFDRVGAVARFRLQISELDKLGDDRRGYSRPLETVSTASGTRQLFRRAHRSLGS